MTKLCLIGYGKMGKMIHQLSADKDCEVVSIIDPQVAGHATQISSQSLNDADVAIDFSHPAVVLSNLETLIKLRQSTVVGTTGWHQELPRIAAAAKAANIGFLYGANFSVGMNLFSRVIAQAVEIFDRFEDYDLLAYEKHHAQKADSPSGTAIDLAQLILAKSSRKNTVIWDRLQRKPQPDELHFASLRGGKIPGTHSLAFDSEADTIELSHVVRSRDTFAFGALMASRWLADKKGVFSFQEMVQDILC
jgi:4-hydroxy-tetrahydrodipicolinate reductase